MTPIGKPTKRRGTEPAPIEVPVPEEVPVPA